MRSEVCSPRPSSQSLSLLRTESFHRVTGERSQAESTKVITCSTYEVNVNRGIGVSTESRASIVCLYFFSFPDFQHSRFSPSIVPAARVGKVVSKKREKPAAIRKVFLRGFGDSPAFTADSPLIPPALSAPARLFLPRLNRGSYGNRESPGNAHLLVPSRYLMVRVKSPITQLPWRYTRTRIHAIRRSAFVLWI